MAKIEALLYFEDYEGNVPILLIFFLNSIPLLAGQTMYNQSQEFQKGPTLKTLSRCCQHIFLNQSHYFWDRPQKFHGLVNVRSTDGANKSALIYWNSQLVACPKRHSNPLS